MIKVTIYQSSEGEISGFAIQGHAGYAESGSDIVCAAVSVLAQNTVNSIEQFTQDGFSADVDEEEGGLYHIKWYIRMNLVFNMCFLCIRD